jgi:hypothetical protein
MYNVTLKTAHSLVQTLLAMTLEVPFTHQQQAATGRQLQYFYANIQKPVFFLACFPQQI